MDNQFQNQQNQNFNQQPNGNAPDYMLWLVLGIVQILTLCCCNCFTFIFGIITVIFACTANTAFKQGNLNSYAEKIRLAKIMNIIGWALIAVSVILNLVTGVFSSILSLAGLE